MKILHEIHGLKRNCDRHVSTDKDRKIRKIDVKTTSENFLTVQKLCILDVINENWYYIAIWGDCMHLEKYGNIFYWNRLKIEIVVVGNTRKVVQYDNVSSTGLPDFNIGTTRAQWVNSVTCFSCSRSRQRLASSRWAPDCRVLKLSSVSFFRFTYSCSNVMCYIFDFRKVSQCFSYVFLNVFYRRCLCSLLNSFGYFCLDRRRLVIDSRFVFYYSIRECFWIWWCR